jgi:DNA helicase-2/ATP-dependent DNA helicase PcrA
LRKDLLEAACTDQIAQIRAAKAGVEALMALFTPGANPSFLAVLRSVAQNRLFAIPESLLPFASDALAPTTEGNEPISSVYEERSTKALEATRDFLNTAFAQIRPYSEYVQGISPFATHQGVKGLEFPRVVVVLDDGEARGFLFSFEKLFGAKEKTPADIKNERDGKETGVDRTRRLLYVTCSRARSSLALVAYSARPTTVRETLLQQGWFEDREIEMLE